MDYILQTYRWDGVGVHQFLMTTTFVLDQIAKSPIHSWSFVEGQYYNADCPTITERAIHCVLHFLHDYDFLRHWEDEGIITVVQSS